MKRILAATALTGVLATVALAGPAAAATVDLAIEVVSDGNGPFTSGDGPGDDDGAQNGIVRTFDAVTYRVTVNANDGAVSNERFTVVAPDGTSWDGVPSQCGQGSGVADRVLTCGLGDLRGGEARAVPVVLDVGGDLGAGDAIRIEGQVRADGTAPVSAVSPVTVVSAAPRYDLAINAVPAVLTPDVTGPTGERGVLLRYPVTVAWEAVVPGQGLLGVERTDGTFHFTDDVSGMNGGGVGGEAHLFASGAEDACGLNRAAVFGQLPAGRGGGDRAVRDSGTITCTQAAPGAPVEVAVTGVDTALDPAALPTLGANGAPVSGGVKPYVISAYLTLWVPSPPAPSSFLARNSAGAVQTTSISGAANYPGAAEPLANNVVERNLAGFVPGNGAKTLTRVRPDGSAATGSAKQGDPYVTAGQQLRSQVHIANPGTAAYRNAIACDVFDNRSQILSTNDAAGVGHATTTGFTNARIEYAAFAYTQQQEARDATCDDADGPWFRSPAEVPGGIAAVGKVRAVGDVAGGGTANLYSFTTVSRVPDGTRVHDFGQLWFGDTSTVGWKHDGYDADLGLGGLADSVIVTQDLARITQKVIDPGHDASDTPDATDTVTSGEAVRFALYPTLTNARPGAQPTDVTVSVLLPVSTEYRSGSASLPPTVETVTDADGAERQRLTWVLAGVAPNDPIDPITYTVRVSGLATTASVVSEAVISSPGDVSAEQFRRADRALRIVSAGGIGVEKSAVEPVVVVGDELRWDLGYTNTDTAAITGTDLIDVLPYDGGPGGAEFHGRAVLAGPLDAVDGERVTYTAAAPDTVQLDGADPSNGAGGATVWCALEAFGSAGCPSGLADVTAFRVQRAAPVSVGATVEHRVALTTTGAADGDRYANRFGLRADGIALPVRSNTATISVAAGAVGDLVWSDEDGDGVQGAGEPGVPDVPVTLSGSDDRGEPVSRTTTTDDHGRYGFDGLRPGDYAVTFTAPEGTAFTARNAGDDPGLDSDADGSGRAAPVELRARHDDEGLLVGVTRDDDVDAGLVTDQGEGGGPGDGGEPEDGDRPGGGGPGAGGDGGDDAGSHDAGAGHADGSSGAATADRSDHGRRGTLAYTGAVIPVGALLVAGAALTLGLLLLRRRRAARTGGRG